MNTHISSGVLRFPLSYRWSKAIHYFKKMKLGQGFKRLNNRFYDKPTYEVEYGKNFPFDEIEQIVKKNVRWSDAKLIKMIERADRATYESWRDEQNGELIEEKVELANYIFDIHEKLSRRLMPKA